MARDWLGIRRVAPGRRAGRRVQRWLIRSDRSRLRPLWAITYELVLRSLACYLSHRLSATVYVRGSLGQDDAVFGLSDIDLVAIARPQTHGRSSVLAPRRRHLVDTRFPLVDSIVCYEQDDVARLAETYLRYELGATANRSLFFPINRLRGLALRPGLWPTRDWRLLAGHELRPSIDAERPEVRRLAVWLELQFWWSQAFRAAVNLEAPWASYVCVKLVAEPARILLWLQHGERHLSRSAVLCRALECFPEERSTIHYVLGLQRDLHRLRQAPLASVLPCAIRLSARIAQLIDDELGSLGATDVTLLGLPGPGCEPSAAMPLCDWRALCRPAAREASFVIHPSRLDDPGVLPQVLERLDRSRPRTLVHDGLIFRPGLGQIQVIGFAGSDPVSAALLAGHRAARFPDVPGWSAADTAARAVSEHDAWLRSRGQLGDSASTPALHRRLSGSFGAARAVLFLESIRAGAAALPISFAAVAEELSRRAPACRQIVQEAYDSLRRVDASGQRPHLATVQDMAALGHDLLDGLRG